MKFHELKYSFDRELSSYNKLLNETNAVPTLERDLFFPDPTQNRGSWSKNLQSQFSSCKNKNLKTFLSTNQRSHCSVMFTVKDVIKK